MIKLLLTLLLFTPMILHAQLDDILKKTVTPDLLEEKNITTSIEDAYPVAFWLDDLSSSWTPVEPDDYSFNLAPGYYKFLVQSYCLKAGTQGPSNGKGHLIAPIKGKEDELVINIIKRSADYPEIKQHDVQLLLWSIIYGAKFTDLYPALQLRVKPLLKDSEIADLSLGIKDMPFDILPTEIKETARFYKNLRNKLTSPASSFEEIENMAVIPGDPPSNLFVKEVTPGNWAYVGNGFYMRIMPQIYSRSVLEVYRPGMVNVTRDELSRITMFELDGYKTEVSYQDEPGSDILFAEGKYLPVYRFKAIKFTGPNPGEEYTIENTGWMIRGDGKELKNVSSYKNFQQDPSLADYNSRLSSANDFFKKMTKYKNDKNKPGKGSETELLGNFDADKHMKDGMNAAMNPSNLKGKGKWIGKNLEHTANWYNCASNVLSGGSCDDSNDPKKFDPEKDAGAPGNTGAQRIAPSKRKF